MTHAEADLRSRTFSWSDPMLNAAEMGRRSGIELLQAMGRGELPAPPITHLMGTGRIEAEVGRVVVTLQPQEFVLILVSADIPRRHIASQQCHSPGEPRRISLIFIKKRPCPGPIFVAREAHGGCDVPLPIPRPVAERRSR